MQVHREAIGCSSSLHRLKQSSGGCRKWMANRQWLSSCVHRHATVFPGSVHPSGESIEWNADGEPERVAPRLLTAAVNALADEIEQRFKPKSLPVNLPDPIYPAALPADITERARKYLATVPPAISGQGGHDQTFYAACRLVQGFCLEPAPALALLREWNQTCKPPWSDHELEHKIAEALKEPGERGYLLNGGDGKSTSHDVMLKSID